MSDNGKSLSTNPASRLKTVRNDGEPGSFGYGKIPPQAIPLEEAVLGAVLLDKEALNTVNEILQPDSFYLEAHQLIFKAMLNLLNKMQPVDLLTLNEEIRRMGKLEDIGGSVYLARLTDKVASSANIEFHARIISQKYIQRELIRVSTISINDAFEDTKDVFDLLDEAEKNLLKITEQFLNSSYLSAGTLAVQARKRLSELSEKEEGLTGVPSGFPALDRLTSGWQMSDLIIVAARPGMGKTSFTLALARNAALTHGKSIALFSLEMSSLQLMMRLISLESEVPGNKLRNGKLDKEEWERFDAAVNKFIDCPIYIDETPQINIFTLSAKCRRLKLNHNIQMVVIDYLQLMRAGGDNKNGNREQEISTISRSLKALAKELNLPVIALSQLNRSTETRNSSKRPQLSDLRESGAIEQDADIVAAIYRPEYYGIEQDDEGNSLQGVAEIIFLKHRNGPLETIQLRFRQEFAKFENLEDSFFQDSPFIENQNAFSDQIMTRSSRGNDDLPFE